MDPLLFLKGMLIGLAVAAPFGPINLLLVQRTLVIGRLAGLLTGIGAATADTIYGVIAVSGVTLLTDVLTGRQEWLRLFGGIFLLFLGLKIAFSRVSAPDRNVSRIDLVSSYVSAFLLTLTTPITIFSFAAVISALGVDYASGTGAMGALLTVFGIFTGSVLWSAALTIVVSLIGNRIDASRMRKINITAGIIVIGFGMIALSGIKF